MRGSREAEKASVDAAEESELPEIKSLCQSRSASGTDAPQTALLE